MERKSLKEYFLQTEQRIGKRINQFLKLLEQNSVYDFSEDSPYSESILSREVKKYFTNLAMQEETDDGEEKE